MRIQSLASSLAASSSSKVSISCAANSVNPRTTANTKIWNVRFKIAPSQLEKMLPLFYFNSHAQVDEHKGFDGTLGVIPLDWWLTALLRGVEQTRSYRPGTSRPAPEGRQG